MWSVRFKKKYFAKKQNMILSLTQNFNTFNHRLEFGADWNSNYRNQFWSLKHTLKNKTVGI